MNVLEWSVLVLAGIQYGTCNLNHDVNHVMIPTGTEGLSNDPILSGPQAHHGNID